MLTPANIFTVLTGPSSSIGRASYRSVWTCFSSRKLLPRIALMEFVQLLPSEPDLVAHPPSLSETLTSLLALSLGSLALQLC